MAGRLGCFFNVIIFTADKSLFSSVPRFVMSLLFILISPGLNQLFSPEIQDPQSCERNHQPEVNLLSVAQVSHCQVRKLSHDNCIIIVNSLTNIGKSFSFNIVIVVYVKFQSTLSLLGEIFDILVNVRISSNVIEKSHFRSFHQNSLQRFSFPYQETETQMAPAC